MQLLQLLSQLLQFQCHSSPDRIIAVEWVPLTLQDPSDSRLQHSLRRHPTVTAAASVASIGCCLFGQLFVSLCRFCSVRPSNVTGGFLPAPFIQIWRMEVAAYDLSVHRCRVRFVVLVVKLANRSRTSSRSQHGLRQLQTAGAKKRSGIARRIQPSKWIHRVLKSKHQQKVSTRKEQVPKHNPLA